MITEGDALLWLDSTVGRSFADKVERAIARYCSKFHHDPDVCYFHVGEGMADLEAKIKLIPSRIVQPNYFWLGVEPIKK